MTEALHPVNDGMVINVKYNYVYKRFNFTRVSGCCCNERPSDSIRDLLYPTPRCKPYLDIIQCVEPYYFYGLPIDVCKNCGYCGKVVRYIDESGNVCHSFYDSCVQTITGGEVGSNDE